MSSAFWRGLHAIIAALSNRHSVLAIFKKACKRLELFFGSKLPVWWRRFNLAVYEGFWRSKHWSRRHIDTWISLGIVIWAGFELGVNYLRPSPHEAAEILYWPLLPALIALFIQHAVKITWRRHQSLERITAHRLFGIRRLGVLVDEFRYDTASLSGNALDNRAQRFLAEALETIAITLFPNRVVSLTYLSRVMTPQGEELRLAGWYPKDLAVDKDFVVSLSDSGEQSYAKLAWDSGKTLYLPYVKQDWAFRVTSPLQAGGPIRYRRAADGLWKKSSRIHDFKSLLVIPSLILSNLANREWEIHGVLNVEGHKRDAFSDVDIFCACVAANKIAQGVKIHAARKHTP